MVLGWRRAFCTSISQEEEPKKSKDSNFSPKPSSSRFVFFSNPSTPRVPKTQPAPSPSLRCRATKETENPNIQWKSSHRSEPSSPRSPFAFFLLKSSLRLSRVRCGICLHSIKMGQGTAIFTAECSHGFHVPCIAMYAKNQGPVTCPTCSSTWKDFQIGEKKQNQRPGLKVYNDDEPLMSPKLVSRFNPIPEDDEDKDEESEFCVAKTNAGMVKQNSTRNVEVMLLPEAAVVSVGRSYETYVVVLKMRAPPAPTNRSLRVPIDLVAVLDVGSGLCTDKVQKMKRAMSLVVSSLTPTDRLSIVAFGTVSKRLLPLRRMTANGKLAARRIIDVLVSTLGNSSATDALKKAAKVLEDRCETNPAATILLISDSPAVSHTSTLTKQFLVQPLVATQLAQLDTPIRSLTLDQACHPDAIKSFSVAVLDLRVQLGLVTGSGRSEISAVYSVSNQTVVPGTIRVGDLYSGEEREFLIELKVPSSLRSHHVLSVKCSHMEPLNQEFSYGKETGLLVPRPNTVRSSSIERLRCLFFSTRAVAESRRLIERGDVSGAIHLLTSTRAVLIRSKSVQADLYLTSLETELSEVQKKREVRAMPGGGEEKVEATTPTSAWRAAERLAKVAIMRKSLNRVSDLHGFEDARF